MYERTKLSILKVYKILNNFILYLRINTYHYYFIVTIINKTRNPTLLFNKQF